MFSRKSLATPGFYVSNSAYSRQGRSAELFLVRKNGEWERITDDGTRITADHSDVPSDIIPTFLAESL